MSVLIIYPSIQLRQQLRHHSSEFCLRQLDVEIDVSYKTIYRRVQRFLRALDAPRPQLEGPVEIDELYVKAGLKGRERDS